MASIAQAKLMTVNFSSKNALDKCKEVFASLLTECKTSNDLIAALETFVSTGTKTLSNVNFFIKFVKKIKY